MADFDTSAGCFPSLTCEVKDIAATYQTARRDAKALDRL